MKEPDAHFLLHVHLLQDLRKQIGRSQFKVQNSCMICCVIEAASHKPKLITGF